MLYKEDLIKKFNLARAERTFVKFTAGILIMLSVLIPKNMYAVTGETLKKFKQTYAQIMQIMEANKTTDSNGNITYSISDSIQVKINNSMDTAMVSLEKDVKEDIENQNWGECQKHLEILLNLAHALGLKNYEKRMLSLLQEVHSDFSNHVRLTKEGVYTLKNSGKVYCVGKAFGKNIGLMRSVAEMNARSQLLRYLNVSDARIGLSRVILYQNDNGTVWVLIELQGNVITNDGNNYAIKDLAKKLEEEKRFLL